MAGRRGGGGPIAHFELLRFLLNFAGAVATAFLALGWILAPGETSELFHNLGLVMLFPLVVAAAMVLPMLAVALVVDLVERRSAKRGPKAEPRRGPAATAEGLRSDGPAPMWAPGGGLSAPRPRRRGRPGD